MFRPLFLAASLLAFSTAAQAADCRAVPGLKPILAKRDLRYLMLGEYHGTREMPALAADIACAAAASGRKVIVGVELPIDAQAAIDAYVASDGGRRALRDLLAAPVWREEGGRTTEAIVALLAAARRAGKRHDVRIVAFDALPQPGTSEAREAAMARTLADAPRVRRTASSSR